MNLFRLAWFGLVGMPVWRVVLRYVLYEIGMISWVDLDLLVVGSVCLTWLVSVPLIRLDDTHTLVEIECVPRGNLSLFCLCVCLENGFCAMLLKKYIQEVVAAGHDQIGGVSYQPLRSHL